MQSWPMYQYAASNNAVFAGGDSLHDWKFVTGNVINGALSDVANTIYAESFDHHLYAIAADTGTLLWSADAGKIIMNAPIANAVTVVVGTGTSHIMTDTLQKFMVGTSDGDEIIAFNRSIGKVRWRFHTTGENMPTGFMYQIGAKSVFVFATGSNEVVALDLGRGTQIWHTRVLGAPTMASLNADGGLIFGGGHFSQSLAQRELLRNDRDAFQRLGWTWAVRATDGQLVWTAPYGSGDCTPAIGEGVIAVQRPIPSRKQLDANGQWTAVEYGLEERTGRLLWQYTSQPGTFDVKGSKEGAIAATYANGAFFVSLQFSRELAAIDAKSGRLLWKTPTKGAVKMSPIIADGRVYVGDNSGEFYILDQQSGKLLQSVTFPEGFAASPPLLVGDTLYVANGNAVFAIGQSRLRLGLLPRETAGNLGVH